MSRGRPAAVVALNDDEKNQLLSIARSRALPHGIVRRAQIVLACAEGEANASIARRMKLNPMTVGKWRRRYLERGWKDCTMNCAPDGRAPTKTSASPRSSTPPCNPNRPTLPTWTTRSMAERTGISKSTCSAGSTCSACSRTAKSTSNSPTTPSSSRKSATSWACT